MGRRRRSGRADATVGSDDPTEPPADRRCPVFMKRTLLPMAILSLVVSLFATFAGPAEVSAGGWAVTSLDPIDEPIAGREAVVGFTIRQHGVTPVDLEGVSVRVTRSGEADLVFDAVSDAPDRIGHYTAKVVFPEAATFSWSVEQGWFGPQDLGTIDVSPDGGGSAAGSSWTQSSILRSGLALVGVLCTVVVIRDATRGRRRLHPA
jgi:hypothetical protein